MGNKKLEIIFSVLASIIVVPVVFTICGVYSFSIVLPLIAAIDRAEHGWFLGSLVWHLSLPFIMSIKAAKRVRHEISKALDS